MQTVERISGGQHAREQDLLLVCQLPDPNATTGRVHTTLRDHLLRMRSDPVITLLSLEASRGKEEHLEELFEQALNEDSSEVESCIHT